MTKFAWEEPAGVTATYTIKNNTITRVKIEDEKTEKEILELIKQKPEAAASVIFAARNALNGGIVNAEDGYCLDTALLLFFGEYV